jgi:hypothetical protein
MKLSIAIPYHGNRIRWTIQTVMLAHAKSYVNDIVLSVDPDGTDVVETKKAFRNWKKVRVHVNEKNLFVFRNKVRAVQLCEGEWVAMFDSDNIMSSYYLSSFDREKKNNNVIYCPSIGHQILHYEKFIGADINYSRACQLLDDKNFTMMLNTGNYILHRETWLKALADAIESDYEPRVADQLWINYNCMKAGMVLRAVPGMAYIHTVHKESTFNVHHKGTEGHFDNIFSQMRSDNEDNRRSEAVQHSESGAISPTSNWSATGGRSRYVVQEEPRKDKKELLSS